MRIVGFGTYDRSKHPRVGILLDGLAAHGDEVVELNHPLGFSTADRVAMLARPWTAYRMVLRLVRCWLGLAVDRTRQAGHRPDLVLVGYLGHFDVLLARLLFPRATIALDLLIFAADTAADRGVRPGPKIRLLRVLDLLAIRCASIVVLDTEEHRELLPGDAQHKAVVCPVGAPDEWFSKPEARRRDPGALSVVFYGLFTPLQGTPAIGSALALLAGSEIDVTMIGTGQDLAAAKQAAGDCPNVRWLEWVPADDLPALVASHDVCLGIFGASGKALRVTPNKVYQGAAAGCAIVTSDTAPQRRALADAARYVSTDDPAALAAALRSLANDSAETDRLRTMSHARAEQRFRPAKVSAPLREVVLAGR